MRSQIRHRVVCQRLAALHAGAAARAALLVARLAALVWRAVAAFRTVALTLGATRLLSTHPSPTTVSWTGSICSGHDSSIRRL